MSQIPTLSIERISKKIGQISFPDLSRAIEGFNEITGS
jgi:hypothetical protein